MLYRVRWKNYCSDDDTWEPEAHLEDCREVLLAFKKTMADAKAKKEAEAKKSVVSLCTHIRGCLHSLFLNNFAILVQTFTCFCRVLSLRCIRKRYLHLGAGQWLIIDPAYMYYFCYCIPK